MSLKQMRFQVTSKLIRPNSWIMQTVRQRIPDCWARNGESTSAVSVCLASAVLLAGQTEAVVGSTDREGTC